MILILPKEPNGRPGTKASKSADAVAIFADARHAAERRTIAVSDSAAADERRASRSERRGSQSSRSDDCWWLKRNYVVAEVQVVRAERDSHPSRPV